MTSACTNLVSTLQSLQSSSPFFVTLTYAQALDGSICAKPGVPFKLSSDGSMKFTHQLRTIHDGILVGIGTVLSDNPSLTARLYAGPNPRPIILDRSLKCPVDCKLMKASGHSPIIFYTNQKETEKELNARKLNLQAAGATVVESDGKWETILSILQKEFHIKSLMIEGGARIILSVLEQAMSIVDALIVTIAPLYLGGLIPTAVLKNSIPSFTIKEHVLVDGDIVFLAQFEERSI